MIREIEVIDTCFENGWTYAFLKKTEKGMIVEVSRELNGRNFTYISSIRNTHEINNVLKMAMYSFEKALRANEFNLINEIIENSNNVVRFRK